jgi:hypothetical protein
MAKRSIEKSLEKRDASLKKQEEAKRKELQEIKAERERYQQALDSLRGNVAEKRGRAKKEKPD